VTLPDDFYSADAQVRIRALHGVCPCEHGFAGYETYLGDVKRLQKDSDPGVRAVALKVEEEALEFSEMCDLLGDGKLRLDADLKRRFRKRYVLD
jgi:hypothetical protein